MQPQTPADAVLQGTRTEPLAKTAGGTGNAPAAPGGQLKVLLPSTSPSLNSSWSASNQRLASARNAASDDRRQISPFAQPYPTTPNGSAVAGADEDAATLLERWEKARIRQDRRRLENEAHAEALEYGGRTAGHDAEPHSPSRQSVHSTSRRNSKVCSPADAQTPTRRARRVSDILLPIGTPLFVRESQTSEKLHKLQMPSTTMAPPVGSRKTRRNSYSVGYSAVPPDFARALGMATGSNMSQPSSPKDHSPQLPAPWANTAGALSTTTPRTARTVHMPWQANGMEDGPAQARSSQSVFQPGRPSMPLAAGLSPEPTSTGLGGKLRKLLSRTASRANLLKLPGSGGSMYAADRDMPTGKIGSLASRSLAHEGLAEELEGERPSTLDSTGQGEAAGVSSELPSSGPVSPGATGADMRAVGLASSPSFKKGMGKSANSQLRPLHALSPFVPRLLMDEIANMDERYKAFDQGAVRDLGKASSGLQPSMSEFQGAVMIADVKGFTQLTEILSKKGTAGVELLTNCMNNYFTRVINMILAFDGDVVKFAGDSMIVVFSPTPTEAKGEDLGIHAATLRCAQCAHVLASKLGHMRMKMNGQVEPINVAVTRDPIEVDEGGVMVETDLLRRHATMRRPTTGRMSMTIPTGAAASGLQASDNRSHTVVQHAAQQISALHTMEGSGENSQASVMRSDHSGRASVSLASNLDSSHAHVTVPSQSGQLPELNHMDTIDGSTGHLETGPASGSGSHAQPAAHVAGSGTSFTKNKRANWLTSVMGASKRGNGGASAGGSGGVMVSAGGSGSSASSKAGKIGLGGEAGGMHSSLGGSPAGSTAASLAGSPTASIASALRGARARARTDVGIMGGAGGGVEASGKLLRSEKTSDAALWGEGTGGNMVRREMSLASKLNMPPPVRPIVQNSSRNSTSMVSASYGMVGTAEADLSQTGSFTMDGYLRLGGAGQGPLAAGARRPPAESWAAKFQNLSSGVMGSAGASGSASQAHDAVERSNTSLGSSRPALALPEALQEVPDESGPLKTRFSNEQETVGSGGVHGNLHVTVSGPSRSGPSRSGPSRSRLGMRHLFGSPRKGPSASSLEGNAVGGGSRTTSSSAPPLTKIPGDDVPTANAGQAQTGQAAPAAPAVVEWSEDSYAVEMVAADNSFSGPGSAQGTGLRLSARATANGGSKSFRRGGAGWGTGTLDNVNIDGYMAPGGVGQPIGEASEGDSPAAQTRGRFSLAQGLQNGVLVKASHSNPHMLATALHPSTNFPIQALQASELTSLSISSLHSTPPSTSASNFPSQGDVSSLPHRAVQQQAADSTAEACNNGSGPVAEGVCQWEASDQCEQGWHCWRQWEQARSLFAYGRSKPRRSSTGGCVRPAATGLETLHHVEASGRARRPRRSSTGGFAGPVAEGVFTREVVNSSVENGQSETLFDVNGDPWRASGGDDPGTRRVGSTSLKASFIMGKVRSWFVANTSSKTLNGQAKGRGDDRDDSSAGSDSPTSNSFGYQTAPMGRIAAVAPTYTKPRDSVMEEVQNSEFSLKIMISAGSICVFQVGGLIDEVTDPTVPEVPHWEFFIGDRPMAPLRDQNNRRRCIAQLAAIEDQAGAGEVVGSREVMDLIENEWDIELLPDDVGKLRGPGRPFVIPQRQPQPLVRMLKPSGTFSQGAKQRHGTHRDDSLSPPSTTRAEDVAVAFGPVSGSTVEALVAIGTSAPVVVLDDHIEDQEDHDLAEFFQLPEHIQRRMAGVLRMHVLGSVRSRIEAGHLDFINEIRPLTILFLGFPSLLQDVDDVSHEDQISCVQYCIQKVQEVMRKWDGSLLQFRCDEKGFVGICAFGLPGHTHEDNPSRGILAALDLHHRIKLKQHRVCIGVTTGDLLCTCVGARKMRSEYTVFGDAINLSARLMVKCKKGNVGDILCDHPTHAHAKFKACFEELEPLMVKGKKLPVHVFHVTAFDKAAAAANAAAENQANMDNHHGDGPRTPGSVDRPLVGRDTETSFILNRAANMIAGMATGGAIVIEGNTGMGKTKLLTEVRKSLERIHADTVLSGKPAFHLFFGLADIANKNSKLHPWRRTFQELFAMDRASSLQQQQQQQLDGNSSTSPVSGQQHRSSSSASDAAVTALGNQLAAQIPAYNSEWSKHLAELVDIPLGLVPRGMHQPIDNFVLPGSGGGAGVPDLLGFGQAGVSMQQGQHAQEPVSDGALGSVGGGGRFPAVSVTLPPSNSGVGSLLSGGGAGPSGGGAGCAQLNQQLTLGSEANGAVMMGPDTPRGHLLSASGNMSLAAETKYARVSSNANDTSSIMGRALAGAWAGIGSLTGNTSSRGGRAYTQPPTLGQTSASVQGGGALCQVLNTPRKSSLEPMASLPQDGDMQPQVTSTDRSTVGLVPSLINHAPLLPSRSFNMQRSPSSVHAAAIQGSMAGAATFPPAAGPPMLHTAGPSLHVAAPSMLGPGNTAAATSAAPLKKNSLNFLVHVIREYTSLYGPIIIMLENLHEFDTWSWQLLVKVAEVLSPSVLILATTRPIEMSPSTTSMLVHSKAALYQKVATMYRHLLKLPTTSKVHLEPFTFQQTKALMQGLADNSLFPDQYVLAVKEKTGGMPLYIEKVTEFLCQKPWLADQGGEFTATVNKMIRNLNFQQVIIERMDRLKPAIHLTLKVASVMGQWVDLDILYKFYPINNSKAELRGHLVELERGNFLKPTDTDGVWEFNMVERDIVYEVIPHYQRRRLHAKLAQELERSLEEHHVATLTTIAYHWNQACMGHEVTEVECALKAIEYWQRAAEAGYSGSSLMEALRLYQKAAQIAELLGESMSSSFQANNSQRPSVDVEGGSTEVKNQADGGLSSSGGGGGEDGYGDDMDDNNASFTAVGAAFRGHLNWTLISRITRAQWEKSMASCCLGIVMQHRLEFSNQMEFWDSEDYFELLTEHAIRGLMLLGAPHPQDVLLQDKKPTPMERILCCFRVRQDEPSGWQEGVVLQDQEVTEIRDILLVLIIAAEHYSLQQNGDEYVRLLTFCKRVCIFFNKCSDTGLDPFTDIQSACTTRIKNFRTRRGAAVAPDFELNSPTKDELGLDTYYLTDMAAVQGSQAEH